MSTRLRFVLLLPLLLVLMVGCTKDNQRGAELSGKVAYKGQPVTGGNMTLYFAEAGYPVAISPDGTYKATQLPAGDAVATVTTDHLNSNKPKYGGSSPVPEGVKQGPTGTYVAVPARYKRKETSDLKVTLKAGKNQYDFEMKD